MSLTRSRDYCIIYYDTYTIYYYTCVIYYIYYHYTTIYEISKEHKVLQENKKGYSINKLFRISR